VCANCGSVFDPASFQFVDGRFKENAPPPPGTVPFAPPAVASPTDQPTEGDTRVVWPGDLPAPAGALAEVAAAGHPGQLDQGGQAGPGAAGAAPDLWRYTCASCGAEVVAERTAMAGTCPYCRSPIALVDQMVGQMAPQLVIPFRYTKAQAVRALKKLYLGKRLLPKVFSQQNFVDEVKGLYVPFWIFDFDTDVVEHFSATKVRRLTVGGKRHVTTSYYLVVRGGTANFRGVPVDGSIKMPDEIMESIEPFDLSQAVSFQPSYLAGFLAEVYDVDSEQASTRATERLTGTGGKVFAKTVKGYTSVVLAGAEVKVRRASVVYALLPVWMLTTIWRGKRFTFAMNGQTGRMIGDLPLDRRAYWRWFAIFGLSSAAVAAVVTSLAMVL
jgi:hypothetical protein